MSSAVRWIIPVIVSLLLSSAAAFAQNTAHTDWAADLDYLAKELPAKHCNLFAQRYEDYFLSGVERIKKESAALTDFETALKIQQLIASLGDSHTGLNFAPLADKKRILPLETHWFGDGLFVLAVATENADILGCEIVSIGRAGLAAVSDSLQSLITVDNPSMLKNIVPQLIMSLQILEFFGFATDGHTELGYRTADGDYRTAVVKPAVVTRKNASAVRPDSVAFCDRNRKAFFAEKIFGDSGIYYLQYNRCWSREVEAEYGSLEKAGDLPSFGEFEEAVFKTLETRPVGKIIFDMRYNGGGNSAQGTAFIGRLSKHLEKHPGTKLYVVLGRNTFSSAILNAMDFKRMTNATFVGEATSGKPNHFGEVRTFRLPASGLDVSYSTKYFKRSEEEVNTILPDVVIERSFADFMKGIDPVFEWIKER